LFPHRRNQDGSPAEPTEPEINMIVNDMVRLAERRRRLNDLELLDWTGRQIQSGKSGSIPKHLVPILSRIGLDSHGWCDLVRKFGRTFKRAAGTADSMASEAARRSQRRLSCPGNPLSSCG
jgi:hypothetical protein